MSLPPRKNKLRQTSLTFLPSSVSLATTSQPTISSSLTPRKSTGGPNAIAAKRRRTNASILNFFRTAPNPSLSSRNRLFMGEDYDGDEVYNGNLPDGVEGRAELPNDELLSSLQERKEDQEESMAEVAKIVPRVSRSDDRYPLHLSPYHACRYIKEPFIVGNEGTPKLPHANFPWVDPINLLNPEVGFCQPSSPAVQTPRQRNMLFEKSKAAGDEQRNPLNGERTQEVSQRPLPAVVAAPNTTKVSAKVDHFLGEPVEMSDELSGHGDDYQDNYTLRDDSWEEGVSQGYLETLQGQEDLQCPICKTGLQGVKEDAATIHVNHCLDGVPDSMPPLKLSITSDNPPSRPDQTSAFTPLMTASYEARAWADVVVSGASRRNRQRKSFLTRASNTQARDLPQRRTCPFYKLIFNTPVSVAMDAFKYGAIPHVEAYFLSHFHSDHYGGLTSGWVNGLIWCTRITANLVREKLGVDRRWVREVDWGLETYIGGEAGGDGETLWVTTIPANHCPGSAIFLFERRKGSFDANSKVTLSGNRVVLERVLHTGDFRAAPWMLRHPLLSPSVECIDPDTGLARTRQQWLDTVYLDTTYLNPRYTFPRQSSVVNLSVEFCVGIDSNAPGWSMLGKVHSEDDVGSLLTYKNLVPGSSAATNTCDPHPPGTLLIVVGTYSIGKERFCISLAMALGTKIYAPRKKLHLLATCLDSPLLSSLLTSDPLAAQVHMTPLMDIRPETLQEYLSAFAKLNDGRFTRVIGFRPTGWAYKTPKTTVLPKLKRVQHSNNINSGGGGGVTGGSSNLDWTLPPEPQFTLTDLIPARGSNSVAACYSVPYSEHSSFRELACFISGLNVRKIIPTVNVGSESGRGLMGGWLNRWKDAADRRRRAPPSDIYDAPSSDWVWAQTAGEGVEEVMFMGATPTAQDILRRAIPPNPDILHVRERAFLDVELVE